MLRYRHQLATGGYEVVAVLVPERQPGDPSWAYLCRELEVILVWPNGFDVLSGDR